MITLSVIAPFFEEKSIDILINNWIDYLGTFDEVSNFEILLFNDGSSKEYNNILNKHLNDLDSRVTIINSDINIGPGCGYIELINLAKYEYILITDADDQFLISSINKDSIENLKFYDCILFYRNVKIDSYISKYGARISNFICNRIFKTKLKDFSCAFKLIKTSKIKKMKFSAKYMNYSIDHTSQILLQKVSYIEQICFTNEKVFKKRTLQKEISRAYKRFLFLYYINLKNILINKNIILND